MEVIIQREQRVWLQFTEHTTQLLLNAINGVKERSAVYAELAGAQLPIRAQQEVIAEKPMFGLRQVTLRDQTEVGDVLFVLASPG